MDWQIRYAKNHLSKVVQQVHTQGPQTVTVRGQRAAVVLSAEYYDAVRAGRATLVDHLLEGPPWDDEFAEAVSARPKTPSLDFTL